MSTLRLLTLTTLVAILCSPATFADDRRIHRLGMLALTERECGNEPLRTGA